MNLLLIKINLFVLVLIRLYIEIINLLKDIVYSNVKYFPLSRRDKSSLVKLTVLPKKESSLRRYYFLAKL